MDGQLMKVIHRTCGGHVGYTDDITALKSDKKHLFMLNFKNVFGDKNQANFFCIHCNKLINSHGKLKLLTQQ